MLPAQVNQFALAHGSLYGQLYNRQQVRIACFPAGRQQAGFFIITAVEIGLYSPVMCLSICWKFDVAYRIINLNAPFLEYMAKEYEIPFGGC